MKSLWTMRYDDGQLMKWDGTGWATQGTYAPANWPGTSTDRRMHRLGGCFVYRGSLFTRWMNFDESQPSGIYQHAHIGKYASGDITDHCNCDTDSYNGESWGNVFEYKGKIYWFATQKADHDSTYEQYLLLYIFYYSSGTPTLVRRVCTELGQYNDTLSNRSEWGNNTRVPYISADHDRMYLGAPGGLCSIDSTGRKEQLWQLSGAFDIDATNNVSLSVYGGLPNPTYMLFNDTTTGPSNQRPPATFFDNNYIAMGIWKSKMYGLALSGKFYEIDVSSNVATMKFDVSLDLPITGVGGNTTFTTDDADTGTTDQNLRFVDVNSTTAYGFPWGYSNFRVKVLNYGGVPSTTKWGWVEKIDDSSGRMNITAYDDTSTRFAGQASGAQFKGYWTFTTHHYNSTDFCPRFAAIFSYGSNLWIMGLSSHTFSNTTLANLNNLAVAPWSLTSWNGSAGTGTTYTYRNSGSYFSGASWGFTFDEAAGLMHVFAHDSDTNNVKHYTWDMTQTPPTLTNNGNVYARDSDNSEAVYKGILIDGVAVFDNYDITVTIGTRTLDTPNAKVTIPYTLWGQNPGTPDTCTIKVEYNVGTGWFDCTRKGSEGDPLTSLTSSTTGTSHSFVHDVYADLGTFSGSIQHRISVASQTRN